MKTGWSLIRFLIVIVICTLAIGACAPIPSVPPGDQAPTASVFLPALEQPGAALSPLQPTAASAESVPSPAPTTAVPSPAPLPAVIGPVWEWVASTFEDGTLLAPGDPSLYTFQLLPDGTALVKADCNSGSATYQVAADNRLTLGPIGTTKMACPPDSLDSEFLAQLSNLDRYGFNTEGLSITLLDDAGAIQFRTGAAAPGAESTPSTVITSTVTAETPTAASSPSGADTPAVPEPSTPMPAGLGGTSWRLASLTVDGLTMPPVKETTVTVGVAADGKLITGTTGCNEYRAALATDGSNATITGVALLKPQTCTAGAMLQEIEFVDALLRTRSYAISEDGLTLLSEDDEALLMLVEQ